MERTAKDKAATVKTFTVGKIADTKAYADATAVAAAAGKTLVVQPTDSTTEVNSLAAAASDKFTITLFYAINYADANPAIVPKTDAAAADLPGSMTWLTWTITACKLTDKTAAATKTSIDLSKAQTAAGDTLAWTGKKPAASGSTSGSTTSTTNTTNTTTNSTTNSNSTTNTTTTTKSGAIMRMVAFVFVALAVFNF